MIRTILFLTGAALVSACSINPKNYETEPVVLETPQGTVTCQLYTKRLLDWDRSTARPASMGVEAADRLCQDESKRRQAES